MSENNLQEVAVEVFEAHTQRELLSAASGLSGRLGGPVQQVDPERFLLLVQENEMVARAATVLATAQLLSNGYSQRSLSRMLGFSNASNFSKDRLWNQLASLAEVITEARKAGTLQVPAVNIQVPTNRTDYRIYEFHNVPTGL